MSIPLADQLRRRFAKPRRLVRLSHGIPFSIRDSERAVRDLRSRSLVTSAATSRLLRQEFHQKAGVGVGSHRRDSRTIFDKGILDFGPRRTSASSSSIARRRSSSSTGVEAGWRIQSGSPLSVTWTGLPARVMRFTLSGSRSKVRSEIVFILSDILGQLPCAAVVGWNVRRKAMVRS